MQETWEELRYRKRLVIIIIIFFFLGLSIAGKEGKSGSCTDEETRNSSNNKKK